MANVTGNKERGSCGVCDVVVSEGEGIVCKDCGDVTCKAHATMTGVCTDCVAVGGDKYGQGDDEDDDAADTFVGDDDDDDDDDDEDWR